MPIKWHIEAIKARDEISHTRVKGIIDLVMRVVSFAVTASYSHGY